MRKLTEQDVANVIGTRNAGYVIEQARVKSGGFSDSDHYGIALATYEHGFKYTTWQWHLLEDETPSFYWGHFTDDPEAALRDYQTRE